MLSREEYERPLPPASAVDELIGVLRQLLRSGWHPKGGVKLKIKPMANLTLVYGMRLLPSDEVAEVGDATLKLNNGHDAHVTMHVLEGSKEEIEKQLKTSLEAFFDFYPEI